MVRVRATVYRGEEGWLIKGKPATQIGGWPVSIFWPGSRRGADWIAERVRRREEWSFDQVVG